MRSETVARLAVLEALHLDPVAHHALQVLVVTGDLLAELGCCDACVARLDAAIDEQMAAFQ